MITGNNAAVGSIENGEITAKVNTVPAIVNL